MATLWGLGLGLGAFLAWWSWWTPPTQRSHTQTGWYARTQDRIVLAGMSGLTPGGLLALCAAAALMTFLAVLGVTTSAVLGIAFGILAGRAPWALVVMRARQRTTSRRTVWPEAVDQLQSGIRAGLSLPEALGQLAERGPEPLKDHFAQFANDYRASGTFSEALDSLKTRLADPVGDRIIEALRVTREVGGTDIGTVLRTLGEFLRDDARTRAELEARQSWTVNAARLAVAAPWVVLAMLSTQPANAQAYNSAAGVTLLMIGGIASVVAYRLMVKVGRLPEDVRVLR